MVGLPDPRSHPAASIFPLLEGAKFQALKTDIERYGQREPVVLWRDGSILDGRNRWRACRELGIEPESRIWDAGDPYAFVVSKNVHRRHLNEAQRAMVAARLEQGGHGGPRQDAYMHLASRKDVAQMLSVGVRTVAAARTVQNRGISPLVGLVDQGEAAVSVAAKVAALPEQEQARIVQTVESGEAKTLRDAAQEFSRAERNRALATQARPLNDSPGRFPVVLADPPWRYEHSATRSREIENQYPTMTLADICALPVAQRVTDDAILFLWTTAPKVMEAGRVIEAWGFDYRSCAVWDKERLGMGYYFRVQHELLLVATRGNMPAPQPKARPRSVIRAAQGKHSQKPEQVYGLIEEMYPRLPKIELLARDVRPGWASWGNEL